MEDPRDGVDDEGSPRAAKRRPRARPVPAEGEDGLFTQSWYPLCMASEVEVGKVLGLPFLDSRVVVFRGADGEVQVMSAYCPHLGADLAAGCVVENRIRCAFHHWEYDRAGVCVKTGTGDPPVAGAALFRFPCAERYGLIWAFNGEAPLFDLPALPHAEDELALKVGVYGEVFAVDPWVICANTPDFQHLRAVHGVVFDNVDPSATVEWTDHSMRYDLRGTLPGGEVLEYDLGIVGTTIFRQSGRLNGRWFGYFAALGLPSPGKTKVYMVVAVRRSEGDEASTQALLAGLYAFQTSLVDQDAPILRGVRFTPGLMTKSDRALARFFEYVRQFPRANPAAGFLPGG